MVVHTERLVKNTWNSFLGEATTRRMIFVADSKESKDENENTGELTEDGNLASLRKSSFRPYLGSTSKENHSSSKRAFTRSLPSISTMPTANRTWAGKYRTTKSMYGTQVDSRKPSSSAFAFSGSARSLPGIGDNVNKEVFYSNNHAAINKCKGSPGPIYNVSSSAIKVSAKKKSPSWGFGASTRFASGRRGHLPDLSKADPSSPGPGAYDY
ncbi:hypothetical protein CYMTET_29287 [Cymbomonas tetramitiformis]|uniref:Uncharacterized protein n=1 Tax=Cymbomonas tetramitiformis TaxID=36881 RepID=A0AAE0FLC1_9CHLO|nr:hypothetical protein CYMTET_29287 [Cymbomonas tetramitiformis]